MLLRKNAWLQHLLLPALICLALPSTAQDLPSTRSASFAQFIEEVKATHNLRSMCIYSEMTTEEIRELVMGYAISQGPNKVLDEDMVKRALWHHFPCPFPSDIPELRTPTKEDITGAWIFPASSQLLRYTPRDKTVSPMGGTNPVQCEALALLPNGEHDQVYFMVTNEACPYKKASDLKSFREGVRTTSWSLSEDGILKVTRTDKPDHLEEWEVRVVETPFTIVDVNFEKGDLVTYLRRHPGNDVWASTEFRHFKRLSNQ